MIVESVFATLSGSHDGADLPVEAFGAIGPETGDILHLGATLQEPQKGSEYRRVSSGDRTALLAPRDRIPPWIVRRYKPTLKKKIQEASGLEIVSSSN
jgi:hypothetical protein